MNGARWAFRAGAARRNESAWLRRQLEAEERFGQDSPEERAALERATDYAVEAEMAEDAEEGIE